MYYVYAIKSKDKNRIYVGIAQDIETRIREHNSGKTKSTKFYRLWSLFYFEKLENRLSARLREKKLKSGSGKEFLKRVLKDCACSSNG